MKFSEKWLRTLANPNIHAEEMLDQLTMAGLEVDGTEPAAGKFTNVVVAKIVSIEKHPDADKLNVCQVAMVNKHYRLFVAQQMHAKD